MDEKLSKETCGKNSCRPLQAGTFIFTKFLIFLLDENKYWQHFQIELNQFPYDKDDGINEEKMSYN